MGRTFVEVLVENYDDVALRETGRARGHRIRKERVKALVDTGSAMLCLHKATIEKLGLRFARSAVVRTGNGSVERGIYRPAQITILGRQYLAEVMHVPDDVPPLVGYIPLENLDLVVDPKSNQVIPNPESGGKYTLDLLLLPTAPRAPRPLRARSSRGRSERRHIGHTDRIGPDIFSFWGYLGFDTCVLKGLWLSGTPVALALVDCAAPSPWGDSCRLDNPTTRFYTAFC